MYLSETFLSVTSVMCYVRTEHNTSYERLKRVVSQWLKGNGKECSWEVLCDALRDKLVQMS